MKPKRGEDREVFGIAFLDVISCGFGAVLALVILAKDGEEPTEPAELITQTELIDAPPQGVEIKSEIARLSRQLTELMSREAKLESRLDSAISDVDESVERLQMAKAVAKSEIGQVGSIDSIYAAGIPVGREYVIFLVDTSGSMKAHWQIVMSKIKAIVSAHPTVKGLQIMNDNGHYLIDGYAGRWIPDTQAARQRAIKKLETWSAYSSSSPAEGLEKALKAYAKKDGAVSIYVIGDDFTGASYQYVIDTIDRWNLDPNTGDRSAIIHGIGFSWGLGDRYSTLMREVASQNGGVFVAL